MVDINQGNGEKAPYSITDNFLTDSFLKEALLHRKEIIRNEIELLLESNVEVKLLFRLRGELSDLIELKESGKYPETLDFSKKSFSYLLLQVFESPKLKNILLSRGLIAKGVRKSIVTNCYDFLDESTLSELKK